MRRLKALEDLEGNKVLFKRLYLTRAYTKMFDLAK